VKRFFIYLVFLVIVSILTLYLLGTFGARIEWKRVLNFFSENPWGYFGVLSLAFSWFFDASITYVLINKMIKIPFSFSKSFKMSIIGIFFNKLSPASTGGSIFQIAYLRKNGINLGSSVSIVELRYIIKQIAMLLIASIGFTTAFLITDRSPLTFFLMILGLIFSMSGISFLILIAASHRIRDFILKLTKWMIDFLGFSKKMKPKIPVWKEKMEKEFDNYANSVKIISQNWPITFFAFSLAFLSAIGHLFLAFAAIQSFGIFENIPKGIWDVLAVQAVATMIIYLSPTPGSSGTAEGGFYLFFTPLVPMKFLSTVTLEWRILSYFIPLALSGVIFFLSSIHKMLFDHNGK